nr:MAG TPA: hypothetical protein [Caudoviricetes sp.]
MKIIRNSIIPCKGFTAINLFGVIFVRKEILPQHNISLRNWDIMLNHELIHTAQMKELLYVPFYLLYILEWLIRLAIYRNAREAYRNISFEREAYDKQANFGYIIDDERKPYAFLKYIKRKSTQV